jgi:lysophospholipase L1-like esterase
MLLHSKDNVGSGVTVGTAVRVRERRTLWEHLVANLTLDKQRWLIVAGIFGASYAVIFAALSTAARLRSVTGVGICIAGLIIVSLVFNSVLLQHRNGPHAKQWFRRIAIPSLMVVTGAVLGLIWWRFGRADGFGFAGACLFILGSGHLIAELRGSRKLRLLLGPTIVVLCAASFVVGLVASSYQAAIWPAVLATIGVLASPIGLSLISGEVLHRFASRVRRRRVWIGAAGAATGVIGVWLLVLVGGIELRVAAIIAIVLLVLVGAIAANTPADVLIVVFVLALAWSIAPHGVAPTDSVLPDDGETVIVALGDSFMSGEGAEQFYNGTNRRGENECRRAPTAYAALVVSEQSDAVPDDLAFLACSGARAVHIYERAQYPGEPIGGPVTTDRAGNPSPGMSQLRHLEWLRKDKDIDIRVVIVSIGGNDARFGEIGQACIGPGDCTEIGQRWLANLERVKSRIDQTYQQIRDAVGNTTQVIVAPYPIPISPAACADSLLTANEHRFLYGFTRELNRVLARAAADAGLYYLSEMATVLETHGLRICDGSAGEVGVNFFGLNAVDGLVEQSVNPLNWLHNSLHPNQRGHRMMAEALRTWLETHPNLTPRPDPVVEIGPPDIASVEQIMDDPALKHCGSPRAKPNHCDGSVGDWQSAQVVAIVQRNVVPVLVVVVGTWILWLVIIRSSRDRWRRARTTTTTRTNPANLDINGAVATPRRTT